MSGLCGLVDFAAPHIEPEGLRALAESASYRAPGGIGYRCLGEAGLAHLARHAGDPDQPLLDPVGQVCGALDGRLDNRSELIALLAPEEGAAASDARLLLAAYLRWGEACTDHLLGDFAFAVWDAGRHRLLCAVDPLGIKPLHFARVGALVCFASDAVQVLRHPAVPDGYDEAEIAAYLGSRCEDPERSFFAAVRKLAPGHRLIADAGGLRVERYWSPQPAEIRYARDEDYAAHFLELFQRAVADRLRGAGSSVGIAMSGGLDSTSVAALAQRSPGPDVRAYTFAFDRLTECDERIYSRAMTEELGLEAEPIAVETLWSLESRTPLPLSPDTPFAGWRTCYEEICRRLVAGGSRVLLTGHGGDDLLRGSSLVYAERLRRGDWSAIGEVVRRARKVGKPVSRSLYDYFGRPHLKPVPAWKRSRDEVYANLVETPWYWRVANWHDRSSAASGVEVRHPFLDRRLFEYVLAIPGEQLFRLDGYKSLLRRSMSGVLPERIRRRDDKTRFTSFLDFLLLERVADEVQELLRAPRSADLGMLDKDQLRSAYQGLAAGKRDVSRRALWYALTLEIWLRRCEVIRKNRRRVPGNRLAAA
jgi:asparagine synthase (glutamine-hydrolysing)